MSIDELNKEDLENLAGHELGGRYLLDKYIDRGGYGAVYRGIDKRFDKPVAIKVGGSYRDFMREGRLAAEVQHNHIVQVLDYGLDKGLGYLVMEYLHGDDLEKVFKRQGCKLTDEQLEKFVREVGDALTYAHSERNLIHRDLKPRNVILKEVRSRSGDSGPPGKFVLLDFGIAAKLDTKGTMANITQKGAGTVEYMAPELLKTEPEATPQTDIYAFGVMLYQLMAGRVPFSQSGTSYMALAECLNAISNSPPPPISEIAPDRKYPQPIITLVMQCLDKDPARRPQTMSEVCERFLAGIATPAIAIKRTDPSLTITPDGVQQALDTVPEWRRTTTHPIPHHSTPWAWILTVLLLLIGTVVFVQRSIMPPSSFSNPSGTLSLALETDSKPLVDGEIVELEAGKSVKLTFVINDLPHGKTAEFISPEVPNVRVESKNGDDPKTTKVFVLSVIDLNTLPPAAPVPITLEASVKSHGTIKMPLQLKIKSPVAWLPPSLFEKGFRIPKGQRVHMIGDVIYSSVLECRTPSKATPIKFRLVPGQQVDDRNVTTFYVMESPVTNRLFDEFGFACPDFEVKSQASNPNRDRGWKNAEDFPVTRIYVEEAQKFARWLAGKNGSLPTTLEWDLSSGYYEFCRMVQDEFQKKPEEKIVGFERKRRIIPVIGVETWIGAGPTMCLFKEPGAEPLEEHSPYGCKYDRLKPAPPQKIGRRPQEMTATLRDKKQNFFELREIPADDKGVLKEEVLREKEYEVVLRGLDSSDPAKELMWLDPQGDGDLIKTDKDLNEEGILNLMPGRLAKGEFIGFRVVVLTK